MFIHLEADVGYTLGSAELFGEIAGLQLDNGKVHFHVFSFAKGASHFQPVGQGVGAQIFAEDDEQFDDIRVIRGVKVPGGRLGIKITELENV